MEDNLDKSEANEPQPTYGTGFNIFNSFEEQELYELKLMATFNSTQILQQLRRLINTAYGMHGYDPEKLPKKHSIKIIKEG